MSGAQQPGKAGSNFLYSVVTLRGVFVLIVCAFHFTAAAALYQDCYDCVAITYAIARPVSFGFFILSGFGITWSMHQSGFAPRYAPRFYAKRLMRLEPPYIASIVVILAVRALVSALPGYEGAPFVLEWKRVVLHLGYLIPWFGSYDWYNPAYWTLAVEFQFYILAALLFPLFGHPDWRVRNLTLLIGCALHLAAPDHQYALTTYIPLFLTGIVLYQWHAGIGSQRERLAWLVILTALGYGYPFPAVMLFVTLLCIAFVVNRDHYSRVGDLLGEISYSMYLLHTIVAWTVLKLMQHIPQDLGIRLLEVLLCYVGTLAAAAAFYYVVERPSHSWSKRMKYPRTAS